MIRIFDPDKILQTDSKGLHGGNLKPGGSFSSTLSSELKETPAFEVAYEYVTKNKKGYEGGRNPMKFGIMQTTLRDCDPQGKIAGQVKDLTDEKAKQVYARLWERAGCNKLSYPLNVIHFDTFVQRPSTAGELLKKSNGDPDVYLQMRGKISSLGVQGIDSMEKLLARLAPASKVANAPPANDEIRTQALDGALSSAAGSRAANGDLSRDVHQIRALDSSMSSAPASKVENADSSKSGDDFETAWTFVLRQEGKRFVRNDNGAGPSRFGILQKTLKHFDPKGRIASDVRNLDEKKAKLIYKKIWTETGCDHLPHPLNVVHFDTVVQSPKTAARSLKSCEGDAETYLETRQATLKALKSYRKYAKTWDGRINELSQLIR